MKKVLIGCALVAVLTAVAFSAVEQGDAGGLITPVQTKTEFTGRGDQGYVDAGRILVLETPKFYPAVDAHTHITATPESYELAVKTMDAAGVAVSVNCSGGNGDTFDKNMACAAKYPGRFVQFCGANPRGDEWNAPDVGEALV